MKLLRHVVLAVALALPVGACSTVQQAWNVATSAEVPAQAVVVAANSFNALEVTATNYLRLPKCGKTPSVVCRSPTVSAKLYPLVRSGRKARDAALQFLDTHPGQLGDKGLYDALITSINVLQVVMDQYNVGGAQ